MDRYDTMVLQLPELLFHLVEGLADPGGLAPHFELGLGARGVDHHLKGGKRAQALDMALTRLPLMVPIGMVEQGCLSWCLATYLVVGS